MFSEKVISEIIHEFYDLATKDILIGYHFRHIDDFDEHIPRIIQFWNLQLNGQISDKKYLPFNFMDVHTPLKINQGEIFRWIKLFESILEKYMNSNQLSDNQKKEWMAKVNLFANKLKERLFGPNRP